MNKYGGYYSGVLYHGALGHTKEEVFEMYSGFVSCTYDYEVAEGFASYVEILTAKQLYLSDL